MPHFIGRIPLDTKKYLTQISSGIETPKLNAIYISRKAGTKRSILNESDLLARIQSIINIDTINLEKLTIIEQVKIMKGVSFVIAPHGAGLSWLGFNDHLCHVFEIFTSDYVNDCFEGTCMMGSKRYKYIEQDATQSGGFFVNIDRLVSELSFFIECISKESLLLT